MTLSPSEALLSLPSGTGRAIIESGAVIACHLLGTDTFVKYCRGRGLCIDRGRLLRLERLGLFSPLFRVHAPAEDIPPFSIPFDPSNDWFEKGWAWDTTGLVSTRDVPDSRDKTQEGYYSIFQLYHLELVLTQMTLSVSMDEYIELSGGGDADYQRRGVSWIKYARHTHERLRAHEHRRAIALLCQFISNSYHPLTQTDQRTVQIPGSFGSYSDRWINVYRSDWDWYKVAQTWDPRSAERLFELTPERLRHAFADLARAQAHCDPMEHWYQLTQFVSVSERKRLKGDALKAESLRVGAQMLRLLYKYLYEEELPHPNEVSSHVITHMPELEVRQDIRRHLEFVVNRFKLNPQPSVCLIVEGRSEEIAVTAIFQKQFGAHPGTYGIEIISLGGVDNATGTKEDRFNAIIRLIDYLHHHQTFTFLILDNERYARKLKERAKNARSIHHGRQYVTCAEYIKIWRDSFEFDNFSCIEIAAALTKVAAGKGKFSPAEITACKKDPQSGACLKKLYRQRCGEKIDKVLLTETLLNYMFSTTTGRKIENRPIVKTMRRVARLAAHNPLPIMQEYWEKNQASGYLSKKGT